MVKFPTTPCLFLIRRSYAAASAENVRVAAVQSPAGTVTRKAAATTTTTEKSISSATEKKENFWMRDPNTGNWIPESHCGDNQIDAAELRQKFLPKHRNTNPCVN